MKAWLKPIFKNHIFFLILTSLSIDLAGANPMVVKEFWISTNATRHFYSAGAPGTLDRPLDGSTQVNFDGNMSWLPANSIIHILPGTYQTLGNNAFSGGGFFVKTGQKIIGSGIDVTILKLKSGAPDQSCIINSSSSVASTNIEISDLTCDGNYTSGRYTYLGVGLNGARNTVKRVKVIHLAKFGRNSEAWGIVLSNAHLPDSRGNVIEDCEVSHFAGGTCISAFSFNASSTTTMSGIMRNNHVFATFACIAFNGSWTHDVLIESNYVNGAGVAIYGDTGGCSDLIATRNRFINVGCGVAFNNTVRKNLTFSFNYIQFTNEPSNGTAAFFFISDASSSYTNVVIAGNTVVYKGSQVARFLDMSKITGLKVFNNFVDSKLTNNFYNYKNVSIGSNYDLQNNHLSGLHVPK